MSYRGYTSFNNYMRVVSDCATLKLKADKYALRCEKSQKISLDCEFVAKQLKEFTSLLERYREDGCPKI